MKIHLALVAALVAIAVGAAAALAAARIGRRREARVLALRRRPENASDRCDDSLYSTAIAAFDTLERPVVYAGLNDQGSNDNFPHVGVDGEPIDRGADPAAEIAREDGEHLAREQANIQWLKDTFAAAKDAGASAVLVVWQGDPNFGERGLNAKPPGRRSRPRRSAGGQL